LVIWRKSWRGTTAACIRTAPENKLFLLLPWNLHVVDDFQVPLILGIESIGILLLQRYGGHEFEEPYRGDGTV
jgi:hypothetical protein